MQAFTPPVRHLMGPGPSDIYPAVLEAIHKPTIGHLDPEFIRLMNEIKELMQYAFQTENKLTLPISAPGSAGMEACFANLMEQGDKVIVCVNGVFGKRMCENVERMGGEAVIVDSPWGEAVDVAKVKEAIANNSDAKIIAFVHAETSTGAISDAEAICKLAQDAGMLTIVDAVTSLGGVPLKVDAWGADAVYSGSQKCLSCVPGLSPVTFSDKAVAVIESRKTKVQSWFLDMNLVMGYWGEGVKRSYHHTAPVNALYALHESLRLLKSEGLENAHKRHRDAHNQLKEGLDALGLKFVAPEQDRLPQLNAVYIPEGKDDATIRGYLLKEHNLEIGAGLGDFAGKAWRIGLMGASADSKKVKYCLDALEDALKNA